MTEILDAEKLTPKETAAENPEVTENVTESTSKETDAKEVPATDVDETEKTDSLVPDNPVEDNQVDNEQKAPEDEAPEEEKALEEETSDEADDNSDAKEVMKRYTTKAEVIERLAQLAESDEEISRKEVEHLKSSFYRINNTEKEEAFKAFIENGGKEEEYMPEPIAEEAEFKEKLALVHDKRMAQQQEIEKIKEDNYNKKLEIIEQIKEILNKPEDINKHYNTFKNLQQQWNELKAVPADKATELWKSYQVNVEHFYDTLKLNNEFRAYDFKKNLELKTAICEKAEKLAESNDVVSAFRTLQDLHQQFREIGPVARELREDIWTRFKAASTVINKKHQEFFENRKQQEEENLKGKTNICETIENIDTSTLKSYADWSKATQTITDLQAEWKKLGYAPQKMNEKIYERYRAACDKFFGLKSEFFKTMKEELNKNLDLKKELCEKAEALKDSKEWKETADAMKELQAQWKKIGSVPKKYSESIWKRFVTACDAFFDARSEATSSQRTEQKENLEKKRGIIAKLAEIVPEEAKDDVRDMVRKLQDEWSEIGHVPFKDKDKIYAAYREQLDRLYKFVDGEASRRRVNRFKNDLKGDGNKVRERLMRDYDILKNEIKTYENNLGFLNLSSKSGNSLVEELNRKVDKLKSDLQEIVDKIKVIDEKEAAKNEE